MTGTYIPSVAVQEAENDVGFHEGYNNANPYSEWQYGNRYNPYCNSATCYWSFLAGFRFWSNCTYGEKGEAYTPTYAIRAREHGVWRDKYWRANPGDDVEFDWANNGLIDHVEKVVADDGVTIITVGANTSGGVYYRRRDRRYVSNFVALSEAGQLVPAPPPPPKVRPMFDPALKLRAILPHPGGGHWLGFEGGRVDFYAEGSTSPIIGGMVITDHDRRAFAGHILSRLKHHRYRDRRTQVMKDGYIIVATDGAEYIPQAQT